MLKRIPLVFTPQPEGGFTVTSPVLPGKWLNPGNKRSTVVPDWGGRDLKLGTVRAAVQQLALDWDQFAAA